MASIPPSSDVSSVLCRLALHLVTALNEKDFDFINADSAEVARCIAEDFECRVDKLEPSSWNQMTTAWRTLYSNPNYARPGCYFEVENMSSLVDERKGVTFIYFNLRWRDPKTAISDWVVEHTWKRKDGKWLLARTHTLRGSNLKQGFGF